MYPALLLCSPWTPPDLPSPQRWLLLRYFLTYPVLQHFFSFLSAEALLTLNPYNPLLHGTLCPVFPQEDGDQQHMAASPHWCLHELLADVHSVG
ncbi:hypothetical protein GDO78_015167 [Eleutherodactylus coqui]|uniref:Uncharacterized protein n=1 Tax=Eleutherodactylus coqui TaxID=57060 RepID=A0A8J6BKS4_ELECQ|nr:hypothetical protein GDO78_015167 [Eleutherodactylus coqui]